jgi:periplasmic divalent cation tolerance protein
MSGESLVVLVTAPDVEEAARIGRALVEERLVACANIMPRLRSIYRWQDAIHDDAEVLVIIKTTATRLERLTARVIELHPYDTPEVLALPVAGGSEAYLDWLRQQVEPETQL